MSDTPERIWAWYDAEYEVVTGSLSEKTHEPSAEYVHAYLATAARASGYRKGLAHAAEAAEEYCANEAFGKLLARIIRDMANDK